MKMKIWFTYLYSVFRVCHLFITNHFCWNETRNTIIQTNFDPNSRSWAVTSIKMAPNLKNFFLNFNKFEDSWQSMDVPKIEHHWRTKLDDGLMVQVKGKRKIMPPHFSTGSEQRLFLLPCYSVPHIFWYANDNLQQYRH